MTQEDLAVLGNFGTVWERVSGQRVETAHEPSVSWTELLGELERYWQGCRKLAALAQGSHRSRLMRLAAEARKALSMARTECFLDTGDVCCGELVCNFASYTPYNLRKLCKNAVNLAGLLQKANGEGCLPVEDARKCITDHERVLKELLRECLQ
ncbi:MAG: hypothetical protein IKK17_06230 [Oscillospiraceae bacterium]|nr:hypothetical protein [Oscillospiraceae bacterium]